MSQDQPDRLDRLEAALENMQRRMEQEQQRRDQEQQRRDQEFERQLQMNAEFRTRQEIQSRQISELREANTIALERSQIQSENIELLANMVQAMVEEFRQHRSDGHGA
ncbi:MAG: hypothetical protein C4288_12555 [Leptolyngbya sp. ERB_1_1]